MKIWKKSAMMAAVAVMMTSSAFADVKVGACFEYTGGVAMYGNHISQGFELAAKEINEKGGLWGKEKIVLVKADTKSEPGEAGNAMTKLVFQERVVAVCGPATTGNVMATTPITFGAKIPQIAPSATGETVTLQKDGSVNPMMFRACFIDPFQGSVMAKFAVKNKGTKKVAIYMDKSSDYAKGLAANFEKTLRSLGGKVVATEAYLAKDVDFKAALTRLKAANPEAIYVPGYYEEVSKIIKQARELGINVPLYGGDGWESPVLAEIAGKAALKNCYYVSAFSSDDPDPSIRTFMKAYSNWKGEEADVFVQQGYNAGKVLFDAIERAGKGAKGVDVAKAMAATQNLPIAGGKLSYDARHNPVMPGLIIDLSSGSGKLAAKVEMEQEAA
ncbi:MAG: ABC transporter substrate-binding protein, partial [Clostridia bacterium]|nr:ABC transporter substrate-binding protein [Clostridia bacterium]